MDFRPSHECVCILTIRLVLGYVAILEILPTIDHKRNYDKRKIDSPLHIMAGYIKVRNIQEEVGSTIT